MADSQSFPSALAGQGAVRSLMQPAVTVTFRQVLGRRGFLLLWLSILFSSFGEWLSIMAMFSLITFRLKGSPLEVSLVMIAYILPLAVIGPLAGVFVDRWNVNRTLVGANVVRTVLVALLAAARDLPEFYVLIFAASAMSTFVTPGQSVLIPLLVRQEELLVANAIATQTLQLNKVIGPGIAGLIVAAATERYCFLIGAATFLFSAVLLHRMPPVPRASSDGRRVGPILGEFREGLAVLVGNRAILFVALSMIVAMFAIGLFDALIAVYVREELGEKSQIFGAVLSVVGVGTIIGAHLLSRFCQRLCRVRMVVFGILGIGAAILAIAAVRHVSTTLGCSLALGMGVAAVMVSSQTLLQEQVPGKLLGRVMSTGLSVVTVSQLAAFSLAGAIAGPVGIRNLFVAAAAILVATALAGFLFAPRDGAAPPGA